ncbi:hypothetical protein BRC75_03675 [Halobacteriales archaeon QH_7_69_31]|nr:MAG: hypothetical protein BRC75_03675 [Halobacteriales archaeon QH_7_69_31]
MDVAAGRLELAREGCDSEHRDAVEGAHDRMNAVEYLLMLARDGDRVRKPEPVVAADWLDAAGRTSDGRRDHP